MNSSKSAHGITPSQQNDLVSSFGLSVSVCVTSTVRRLLLVGRGLDRAAPSAFGLPNAILFGLSNVTWRLMTHSDNNNRFPSWFNGFIHLIVFELKTDVQAVRCLIPAPYSTLSHDTSLEECRRVPSYLFGRYRLAVNDGDHAATGG